MQIGSSGETISLPIDRPPAAGDWIDIQSSCKQLKLELRTPNRQGITEENAASAGVDWLVDRSFVPLGEDGSQNIRVVFAESASAGVYHLHFDPLPAAVTAQVEVKFVSRLEEYAKFLRSVRNARILPKQTIRGSGDLVFDLLPALNEDALAMLDIVVCDPKAAVSVRLPSGRVLTKQSHREQRWDTYQEKYGKNDDSPMFSEALLPLDGTHHVVALGKMERGRYVVHVASSAPVTQVTAAFLPLAGIADALKGREQAARQPAPGEIKIQPQTLPYDCFAGDVLPISIKLLGHVGSKAPKFEVRIERRTFVGGTETGVRLSDALPVEVTPIQLLRQDDGDWHGNLTMREPGQVFVSLRASGITTRGKPFSTEVLISNSTINVNPVVAALVSVSAKAIDMNGDGKFDRLDVSADLDVFTPGSYSVGFAITDSTGRKITPSQTVTLAAGRQTVTKSIPGSSIWRDLRDGPFQVTLWSILRQEQAYLVSVRLPKTQIQTDSWHRDQWNRGSLYGDDTVTVHGIRPAVSGRFRFVEVEWNVTTPGGPYRSDAGIFETGTNPSTREPLVINKDVHEKGVLAPGRSTLSFVFDAAAIAIPGVNTSTFSAGLGCESDHDVIRIDQKLTFDPKLYERARTSFSIETENLIRLAPNESYSAYIGVPNKAPEQVEFNIDSVPNGLDAHLSYPTKAGKRADATVVVHTVPHVAPGRYVIGASAKSGNEIAVTELLVDVVPFAAAQEEKPVVRITSPADRAIVYPGESFSANVEALGAKFLGVAMVPPYGTPLNLTTGIVREPPFTFTLTVPKGLEPGLYPLSAVGVTDSKQQVFSNQIWSDIERPDSPASIKIEPEGPYRLHPGESLALHVVGSYKDGSNVVLNRSSKTRFVSNNPSLVTFYDNGRIAAYEQGETDLVIHVGPSAITIHVTIAKWERKL